MIRLIASDIDGTLLLNGSREIPAEVLEMIPRLAAKGVLFCAASGRQYPNLKALFAPVWEKMLFICENGALVMRGDEPLAVLPMPRPESLQLIEEIQARPGCEVQVSGRDCVYISPRSPSFVDHIRNFVKNKTVLCEDFSAVEEPFLKVSINMAAGVDDETLRWFAARWSNRLNVALAGRCWLDFTVADKSQGLAALCQTLDIPAADTAAFGDGFNDVGMLQLAGHSWAMQHAAPAVQAAAGRTCNRVEPILRSILEGVQ